MNARKWLVCFGIEVSMLIMAALSLVVLVDPYFHYHGPMDSLFYTLNNERSQNDGILKHFDYDSIITGTSMAQNFKTTEFNEIFHANSIKVCFSGGSYKEINDNLKKAFDSEHDIKYVLRCLDYKLLIEDKDMMRLDLGEYPSYLYDRNPFNDVKYILNKEIICNICIPMLDDFLDGRMGGITSFDEYSNWNKDKVHPFGAKSVLGDKREFVKAEKERGFTDEDCETVKDTVNQNIIKLAKEHPETTFYYFFSPYSIAYWGTLYEDGNLNRQIDGEKVAIEQILKYENIELYSFNNFWDITTDLDNYKDSIHYGEWINTEILHMIHNGIGRLTKDNYEEYLSKEREFYSNYTYQFSVDEE